MPSLKDIPHLSSEKFSMHRQRQEARIRGGGRDFIEGVGSGASKGIFEGMFDYADNGNYRRDCILMHTFGMERIIERLFDQTGLRTKVRIQ